MIWFSALWITSFTSVLLPEPDTPVTHTNLPNGISTSTCFRLFAAAPNTRSKDNVQAYVAAMRADLARGKVQTISAVMKLTTDEGRVFWPIYHDYETEQLELGAQRGAWLEKYRDAAELQRINDGQAKELAESYFKFEQQRLDLLKKYHEIRSREVSPVCAAQFTQAEHRIATLSDLLIASETPMIDTGLADATK